MIEDVSPIWDILHSPTRSEAAGRPPYKELAKEFLRDKIKNEWVGLVLKSYGRDLPAAPAFQVQSTTTPEEFMEAVETEWRHDGDMHHKFIESFEASGMWLVIWTGS